MQTAQVGHISDTFDVSDISDNSVCAGACTLQHRVHAGQERAQAVQAAQVGPTFWHSPALRHAGCRPSASAASWLAWPGTCASTAGSSDEPKCGHLPAPVHAHCSFVAGLARNVRKQCRQLRWATNLTSLTVLTLLKILPALAHAHCSVVSTSAKNVRSSAASSGGVQIWHMHALVHARCRQFTAAECTRQRPCSFKTWSTGTDQPLCRMVQKIWVAAADFSIWGQPLAVAFCSA